MNEIKSYLYSRTTPAEEVENWEICLWRVKYNEFLGMAQERRSQILLGWMPIHVDTELNGYFEMVKIINAEANKEAPRELQAAAVPLTS